MEFKRLSILIPVYNEKHTIEAILNEVLNAEIPDNLEKEIIVVDDGSNDGTREILRKIEERKISNLKVIYKEKNSGKGDSIRVALENSTGDICIIQDADLEYNPKDYKNLILPIIKGDADVVYGSRFFPSSYARVLYFWHYLGNKFLTFLSNCFTNLNLSDMETCYKAAIGPVFRSIPIRSKRFGLEPELTSKFSKRKLRIYEVPISYKGRTYLEGKKINWWDGIKTFGNIFIFWLLNDSIKSEIFEDKTEILKETPLYQLWLIKSIYKYIGERIIEIEPAIGNRISFLLPRERYYGFTFSKDFYEILSLRFGKKKGVKIFLNFSFDEINGNDLEPSFDTALILNRFNFDKNKILGFIKEKLEKEGFLIIKAKKNEIKNLNLNGFLLFKEKKFDPLGDFLIEFRKIFFKDKKPCIFFKMFYERFLFLLKFGSFFPNISGEKIFIFKK